jgi:hypothetical protein
MYVPSETAAGYCTAVGTGAPVVQVLVVASKIMLVVPAAPVDEPPSTYTFVPCAATACAKFPAGIGATLTTVFVSGS